MRSNSIDFRTWGQGNHLITAVLFKKCNCGNTTWVMTKREKMSATYECINVKCRSVLTINYSATIEHHKNLGKPLPVSKDAEKFYQSFTKATTKKVIDVISTTQGKCFVCGVDHGLSGTLSMKKLKIAGLSGSQLITKTVPVLCCEMCVEMLKDNLVLQCGSSSCQNWLWKSRKEYIEENKYKFASPDVAKAFKRGDIVFSEHWKCAECTTESPTKIGNMFQEGVTWALD